MECQRKSFALTGMGWVSVLSQKGTRTYKVGGLIKKCDDFGCTYSLDDPVSVFLLFSLIFLSIKGFASHLILNKTALPYFHGFMGTITHMLQRNTEKTWVYFGL